MSEQRPKAVRDGYSPSPFFFRQQNERNRTRTVAWTGSAHDQQSLLTSLIQSLPERLEVLLKVEIEASAATENQDKWQRYFGVVDRGALLDAIRRCEAFVFRDSRNQLCVRDPETLEYIVLDHVGVVYIYSDNEIFRDVLVRAGFEERLESLIGDEGYWGQTPDGGEAAGVEFRRMLELEPVPGPNESRDSGGAGSE